MASEARQSKCPRLSGKDSKRSRKRRKEQISQHADGDQKNRVSACHDGGC